MSDRRSDLGRRTGALVIGLAAVVFVPAVSASDCPVYSTELEVKARSRPSRGEARELTAAIRDSGGARVVTIQLDLEPGSEARSERSVPGGGTFLLDAGLAGDGRSVRYATEYQREGCSPVVHRAQISLGE
jgi:hypothetical protein